VPARLVQRQHDLLLGAGSCLTRKGGQFGFKQRDTHRGRQAEEGATRGRLDEAREVALLVAMLHRSERTLTVDTPHFVQNRLEPNPVRVDRQEVDLRLREGGRDLPQERSQPRLDGRLRHRTAWM
jgi:hypothetical protein